MAATLTQRLRQISQSFQFQQFLRRNERLAKTAARGRDLVALEFLRARDLSGGYAAPYYAEAVAAGFDPNAPFNPYQPPPVSPPLPEPHAVGDSSPLPFVLQRTPQGGLVDRFDMTPQIGSSLGALVDASAAAGRDMRVYLHDLQDDCLLYVGNTRDAYLDERLSEYSPASGGTEFTLTYAELSAYEGQQVPVAVFHSGPLPFVMGTLSVEFL